MLKSIFFLLFGLIFIQTSFAQTTITPAEKKVTDTICNCLSGLDLDKIKNKQEAVTLFTECFGKRMDLLLAVAEERHLDETDEAAMKQLGIGIAKILMAQNCAAFTKLAVKMATDQVDKAEKIESKEGTSEGKLKRIELKGFNYLIISDNNNSEKSFLWLRQFPGSEKFMNGVTAIAGKKVKVSWRELEVYLPSSKGYYAVKEITGIDFL